MYDNKEAIKLLRNVAGKTKSKMAIKLADEKEYALACNMAHELFDEALKEAKEGDRTWKEIVDDLSKNLKAISMSGKEKPDGEDGD